MNSLSPFTVKQREYLIRCISSWFNVAEGGKRGGKNVLQTMAFCVCLDEHPNKIHLIAGVSTSTARLNILDCDGYGLSNYFEGRCRTGQYQNRDCLYIRSRTGEKVVLVSGGGKKGDEKLIKGNTYGMAYVTEANECAQVFLQEVFDRTLSSKDRKVFHDLNPKAESHWYYTDILHFHEEQQNTRPTYGYNYGHFTIADNMSVSDAELQTRIGTYNKKSVWYQRDILGKRKQVDGLVYPMFYEKAHVTSNIPKLFGISISVDVGQSNATVFLATGEGIDNRLYCLKEYYHSGKKTGHTKSPLAYAKDFEIWIASLLEEYPDHLIDDIWIDPSALGFRAQLRDQGFTTSAANNDVVPGIQTVSSVIDADLLRVHPNCKNLLDELHTYSWDDKAATRGEDKPLKENDHVCDCLRYRIHSCKYDWVGRSPIEPIDD